MKLKVLYNKFVYRAKGILSFIRTFSKSGVHDIKESTIAKIPNMMLSRGIILFVCALALFLSIGFVRSFETLKPFYIEKAADFGGVYRESITGEFSNLNPLFSQGQPDADAVKLIYSGLTKKNARNEVEGDLAESWAVDGSNKQYTFKLRKGVRWHDGVEFNADDVVFTFSKITTPDVKSPFKSAWENVRVEKIDEHTVRFFLPNPYSPFLSLTSQAILSEHRYGKVQDRNMSISELNQTPVGTGPFKLAGEGPVFLSEGIQVLALIRNEDYFGARPYLDGIELKAYPDISDTLNAYAERQVEGVAEIPPQLFASADKFEKLNINSHSRGAVYTLFVNLKSPLLSDLGTRRILVKTVNKERILGEAYRGQGVVTNRMIPRGYIGYTNLKYKKTFNLQQAGQEFAELGWKKNDGGMLAQKDKVFVMTMIALDTEENRAAGKIIQEDLKSLGIELQLNFGGLAELENNYLRERSFDLFLTAFSLGYETDPYPFFHSTQTESPLLNFSGLNSADGDRLLEGARRVDERGGRALRLKEFENILIDEVPAIFILHPYYLHGVDEEIKLPLDLERFKIVEPKDRFTGVERWYIREKEVERRILSKIK